METDKIDAIEPSSAIDRVDSLTVITSGEIGDIAKTVTEGVGARLIQKIDLAVTDASELVNITDVKSRGKAMEYRKTLKALVTNEGGPSNPCRMLVRASLAIVGDDDVPQGFVVETTIGLTSIDDFCENMAAILNRMHKGITQSRGEMVKRVEAARASLEQSILRFDDAERRRVQEQERQQRIVNEQRQRTSDAKHWIEKLQELGVTQEQIGCLVSDVNKATETEVCTLSDLVREEMEKKARAEEQKQISEAVSTAKQLGMPLTAEELYTDQPIVMAAPEPPPMIPTMSSVASSFDTSKGKKKAWILEIVNPGEIQAEFLLPPAGKEKDPDAYPRIKALMRTEGDGLMKRCKGIKITDKEKLTR